jgi:hypothetical protein
MGVVRVGRFARRDLPEAHAEALGARLTADPGALGAEAVVVAVLVEVRLVDVDRHLRILLTPCSDASIT